MSKKVFKPFSWWVIRYDCNANKIISYDVLKYEEDFIKKLKKKCETREEFSEKLRREIMYYYWGKCEAEVLIRCEDNRIYIRPWVGSRNPEEVEIDVTDRTDYDWRGFYEHMKEKRYVNKEGFCKVDIYEQLLYIWPQFLDYVINYRHKYQREDYAKKFAKETENNIV